MATQETIAQELKNKYSSLESLQWSKEYSWLSEWLKTMASNLYWQPQQQSQQPQQYTDASGRSISKTAYEAQQRAWLQPQQAQQQPQQQPQTQQQPQQPQQVQQKQVDLWTAPSQDGIVLQTPNEQITKLPDYKDTTDKRLKEIGNNLKTYEKTNPELFNSRQTYSKAFNYSWRTPEQQAILDSFWTSKQWQIQQKQQLWDISYKMNQFNMLNWDELVDRWLSNEELMQLKSSYPDKYNEYKTSLDKKNKLAIINWDATEGSTIDNKLSSLFGSSEVPQIKELYDTKIKEIEPLQESLNIKKTELKEIETEMGNVLDDTRKQFESTWATDSYVRALASKKMEELSDIYQKKINAYNSELDNYNTKYGNITNEINMVKDQYNLDQQAISNKMQQLWFYYQYDPQGISEMATAKYNAENPDMNSTDPATQKQALNQTLDKYYEDYGSIIQRPKAQVISDIQEYAKSKWISVSQALKENFITPLQNKTEYKMMLNKALGIEQNQWTQTWDPETQSWKTTISGNGKPQYSTISRLSWVNTASQLAQLSWWNNTTLANSIQTNYSDWTLYGQCWEFANDIYKGTTWTSTNIFGNDYQSKINAINNIGKSSVPVVWWYVVMSSSTSPESWHVGIVTSVNSDGTFNMKSSNYKWDEKIRTDNNLSTNGKTFSIAPTISQKSDKIWWIDYSTAFSLLSFPTAVKSEQEQENIKKLVSEWNIEAVKSKLMNLAVNNIDWAAAKNEYQATRTMVWTLNKIQWILDKAKKLWVPTWYMSGKYEDMVNKFGKSSNPEIVKLGTTLKDQLDALRRWRSWAALTEFEEAFYDSIFPSAWKSYDLNTANINGLLDSRNMVFRTYLENSYTSEIADQLLWPTSNTETNEYSFLNKNNQWVGNVSTMNRDSYLK